ncbi:MAG: RraA family protein [Acidimicrobiia bacterium]|nr:RraA family protein [Acidimicrobiia bacterium]
MTQGKPDSADLHPGPGFRIRTEVKRHDAALIERLAAFETPVISDTLNRLYAFDFEIRCLTEASKLAGSICTVRVFPGDNLMVHKALDVAAPDDVIVISAGGGGGSPNAIIGDRVCAKAKHRGIRGFVVDGLIRDLPGVLPLGMPVYARGTTTIGPLHRGPGEINYPIACGGTVTNPGDVLVADEAGIVVVPHAHVDEIVLRLEGAAPAMEKYEAALARGEFSTTWVDTLLGEARCPID